MIKDIQESQKESQDLQNSEENQQNEGSDDEKGQSKEIVVSQNNGQHSKVKPSTLTNMRPSFRNSQQNANLFKSKSIDSMQQPRTRKPISQQQRAMIRGYDGQKIPPDFEKAAEHRVANKVGPEKDIDDMKEDETIEYCECCARQIQRRQLSVKCNIYELSFLGSGYPLYFQFLKQCMVLLILVLSFSGIFNVITNIIGSQKCTKDSSSTATETTTQSSEAVCRSGNGLNIFSLGSKSDQNTFMEIQGYLNLASLVAMIALLQWFRKLQRQLDAKCDDADISANDYTIMVKNVPKEFDAINDDYDDDIKEFFKQNSLADKQVEVESVTLCYDLTEITNLDKKKEKLIQQKKKCVQSVNNLKKKIDEVFSVGYRTEGKDDQEQGIKIFSDRKNSIESNGNGYENKQYFNFQPQKNEITNNNGVEDGHKKRISIIDHIQQQQHHQQQVQGNSNPNLDQQDEENKSSKDDVSKQQFPIFSEKHQFDQQSNAKASPEPLINKRQREQVESYFKKQQKDEQKVRTVNLQKRPLRQNKFSMSSLGKLNDQLTEQTATMLSLEKQIEQVNKQLKYLNEKLMDGKGREFMKQYFTGIAFVCLKYEQDKEDIIDRYRPIGLSDRILSKEKNLVSHSMIYQNSKLKIVQAPDPTDVSWTNLHLSKSEKLRRRTYGFLFAVIALLLCAIAIYAFHIFQESEINDGAEQNSVKLQIISSCLAILISLLNFLLSIILSVISAYCKYSTRTEVNIFIAKGLSLARFINSALISFIIQIFVQNKKDKQTTLFGEGGLADNANYFMISNCFVPALAQLVHIEYYVLEILRRIENKKGIESLMTQAELNLLYENPQFPIEERYAQLLMTMFTTAFYCPIVPMTIVWSIIGLILQYWIDKYNVIYRSSVKYNMSADLSIEMTEHLEYFLPIQSISTLIFYQYANGGDWGLSSIVGTALGLLHAFLPMQLINERFFDVDKANANTIDYEEAQKYFITDYSRENPIYKQQARQTHVKKMTVRISNQKDFLRQNTIRSNNNAELDHSIRFGKMNSVENKSNFNSQQSPSLDNHRQLFLPFKTIEEQDRNSYSNIAKTQETFQTNEDEIQLTKPAISNNQKRALFSNVKQITNDTNLGLIEEEMVSVNSNLALGNMTSQSKQEQENQQSPQMHLHNRSYSTQQIQENSTRSTLGKKILMCKINKKSDEVESVEMQPSQQMIQLYPTSDTINQNGKSNLDNHAVSLTERDPLTVQRKNQSCDFQSQHTGLSKPSIFSNQQFYSDKKDEKLKDKYNQVRKNLNNIENFILPATKTNPNEDYVNEQQVEIVIKANQ